MKHNSYLGPVNSAPEESENEAIIPKTYQMFFVHTMPGIENHEDHR